MCVCVGISCLWLHVAATLVVAGDGELVVGWGGGRPLSFSVPGFINFNRNTKNQTRKTISVIDYLINNENVDYE